jgi:hypothetical protein
MKILHFIIFIANPGSRIGSSYFYRGSGIPDLDPFIFIADPGSRIQILLFLSRIWDPGSSYFIADLSRIRIRFRIQSLVKSLKVNIRGVSLRWSARLKEKQGTGGAPPAQQERQQTLRSFSRRSHKAPSKIQVESRI